MKVYYHYYTIIILTNRDRIYVILIRITRISVVKKKRREEKIPNKVFYIAINEPVFLIILIKINVTNYQSLLVVNCLFVSKITFRDVLMCIVFHIKPN